MVKNPKCAVEPKISGFTVEKSLPLVSLAVYFIELLKRLEDRLNIQRRTVDEVLPKALEEEKAVIAELRDLIGQSDFTDRNLNELRVRREEEIAAD